MMYCLVSGIGRRYKGCFAKVKTIQERDVKVN